LNDRITIAAAQLSPVMENIDSNLREHLMLIRAAAERDVKLIAFPELSITGYLKGQAESLAFMRNDARLDPLREAAARFSMIIIAGAPVRLDTGLHIGALIFHPDGTVSVYTKQHLHTGEEKYFTPNPEHNPVIELCGERISLAICADIANPVHAQNACGSGCTIYIAGIFYTKNIMDSAYKLLPEYAKTHGMNVLMANSCGFTCGYKAGGKSAFWTSDGILLKAAGSEHAGLVVVRKGHDSIWRGVNV
jgi:predicted amidohydrolase